MVYRVQNSYISSPYEDTRVHVLLWLNMDLRCHVLVDQSLMSSKSCIISIIHSSQIYSHSYEYDRVASTNSYATMVTHNIPYLPILASTSSTN